jgi:predicted GNAT family acetyltransferase
MSFDRDIRKQLIADLVESDVAYFEAGAEIEMLPGATIAHMPGLHSLAAGCVVQRVDTDVLERDPGQFIDRVEMALHELGSRQSRIYLRHYSSNAEHALMARGYRARVELAIALDNAKHASPTTVAFRAIASDEDWALKTHIHNAMTTAPDGHSVRADDWVAMERLKSEAGYMTPYLVTCDQEVVGAVSAAPWKSVLRLKNVFVHPDWRLLGVGTGIAQQFGPLALQMGKVAAGALVLADATFISMYTNAGYEVVSQLTEWCKELKSPGTQAE